MRYLLRRLGPLASHARPSRGSVTLDAVRFLRGRRPAVDRHVGLELLRQAGRVRLPETAEDLQDPDPFHGPGIGQGPLHRLNQPPRDLIPWLTRRARYQVPIRALALASFTAFFSESMS